MTIAGQGVVLLSEVNFLVPLLIPGHQGEAVHEAGDGDAMRHEVGVDHALNQETVHTPLQTCQDTCRETCRLLKAFFLIGKFN